MYAFKLHIYDIFKFQGVMVQNVTENGFITVFKQLGKLVFVKYLQNPDVE